MKILIVDDERSILDTLEMFFQQKGFEVLTSQNAKSSLALVRQHSPEIVILDIRLPDLNGLEVLRRIKAMKKDLSVIMMTAYHDMNTTIQAMRLGAFDYIHKPIDINELEMAIDKLVENLRLSSRLENFVREISHDYRLNNIVGETKGMQEIFKTIGLVSETRATVLIQGESGTGKELIAKAIHYNSPYNTEPFITVDCSTLVETLAESELFGHEKGAFTGAMARKKGKVELAEHGTLFLDEIGELPSLLQVKLLRFLQEKEFERVGGERSFETDARVIAATNRDLAEMVQQGTFRKDLYYRLRVIEIHVPPLRERAPDIPLLVEHFLNKANSMLGKNVSKVPKGVMNALIEYPWPGNVRELENVITRAVVLSKGCVLLSDYFPEEIIGTKKDMKNGSQIKSLAEVEAEHLLKALEFTHWHQGKACELLGITRPTLREKIKKYGLCNPKNSGFIR